MIPPGYQFLQSATMEHALYMCIQIPSLHTINIVNVYMLQGYHNLQASSQDAMWHALPNLLSTKHDSAPNFIMGDFNAHLMDSYTYKVQVFPCHSLPCKPLRGNPSGLTGAPIRLWLISLTQTMAYYQWLPTPA